MFLKRFLRRPGMACPVEALAGDEALDTYIRDLDSRLLGSKHVRLLTLAEIRDHLEEAKAQGVAAGLGELTAAERAASAMGPAEDYARDQRASLRGRFLKTAGAFGALIVATTFAWQSVLPTGWHPVRALLFALYVGAIGGLGTGWSMVYRWPIRWISAVRPASYGSPAQFDVTLPRPIATSLVAAYVWIAASTVAIAVVCIFSLLHPGSLLSAAAGEVLLAINLFGIVGVVLELNRTPRALHVGPAGVWARMWTGTEVDIPWHAVTGAGYVRWTPRMLLKWRPRAGAYIEYRSMSGRIRRTWFRRDMLNADRLLNMAEQSAERNRMSCQETDCMTAAATS
jgi:hypothetical protein